MSEPIAVVSISGGKDSLATALVAIERYGHDRVRLVMADTGHEHPLTVQYATVYLPGRLNLPIEVVRADFTSDFARKRAYIEAHWFDDLTAGAPGEWVWRGRHSDERTPKPVEDGLSRNALSDGWRWRAPTLPMSASEAERRVSRALELLHPTGNPYLDLCMMKGRFPSRRAQFCTEELKRKPLDAFMVALVKAGLNVQSWQGVRRDESEARRDALKRERSDWGWDIVRPIVDWTAAEAIAYATERGINQNPLYRQGMKRVGCMPCINCGKDELREIAARWPAEIERVAEWERIVSECSKRGATTLFHGAADREQETDLEIFGRLNIKEQVKWAKTSRGGVQFDLERFMPATECSSAYGLCE